MAKDKRQTKISSLSASKARADKVRTKVYKAGKKQMTTVNKVREFFFPAMPPFRKKIKKINKDIEGHIDRIAKTAGNQAATKDAKALAKARAIRAKNTHHQEKGNNNAVN